MLGAIMALALSATTVFAAPPQPATTPIDDAFGNPFAPGVNIVRKVSTGDVRVKLNGGNRSAQFSVILRGVEATVIDDNFKRDNGVDGPHTYGIWGGCDNDEIVTNPGKSGNVAMAKFTTCGDHDSILIRLSEPIIGNGSFPDIKIVFTDGVSENVDGVFVGNYLNGADMTNTWIPLYR